MLRRRRTAAAVLVGTFTAVAPLGFDVHPVDGAGGSFTFDGTTSDLSQQFYHLAQDASTTTTALALTMNDLPSDVVNRMKKHSLAFEKLPPLLQRAVLWDSGFVLEKSSKTKLVQVYTTCGDSGNTMADIAVSEEDYLSAGCTPDTTCGVFKRNGGCSGTQISKVARCAAEAVSLSAKFNHSMWAIGGTPDMLPQPNFVRHDWKQDGMPQLIYAIHTIDADEPLYNVCPKSKDVNGIIIPCIVKNDSARSWCPPKPGNTVDAWLEATAKTLASTAGSTSSGPLPSTTRARQAPSPSSTSNIGHSSNTDNSSFKMIYLVPIIAVLLLVIVAGIWLARRKRRDRNCTEYTDNFDRCSPPRKYSMPDEVLTPLGANAVASEVSASDYGRLNEDIDRSEDGSRGTRPSTWTVDSSIASTLPSRYSRQQQPVTSTASSSLETRDQPSVYSGSSSQSNSFAPTRSTLYHSNHQSRLPPRLPQSLSVLEQALLDDPVLVRRRVALDDIRFERMIASGAFGEVWFAKCRGIPVAVKRLPVQKHDAFKELKAFVAEIQLTASLDHPHIIKFVAVAWGTMDTICMALEFLSQGDLSTYLRQNHDMLSWSKDKLPIAIGLADAVAYLHDRKPILIHRDIKSRNVMLTERLQPRLIDFGISRDRVQETMTAGVGTPYWTAPEVLEGERYTEKSDIYSFGVLLSEMDTAEVPYQNLTSEHDGTSMKTLKILNMIVEGSLRPSFTKDCPPRILVIARHCLERNPAKRPSAVELLEMLRRGSHQARVERGW